MIDRRAKNRATQRGTTRGLVDVGAETRTAALKQKLKFTVRTTDSAQHGNPREGFRRAFKKTKMETSEMLDNKSNSAVTKEDGNPDEISLVATELL